MTEALPIEKQAEVLDFVEFLRARSAPQAESEAVRKARRVKVGRNRERIAERAEPLRYMALHLVDSRRDGLLLGIP